jgi:hypothetical protein
MLLQYRIYSTAQYGATLPSFIPVCVRSSILYLSDLVVAVPPGSRPVRWLSPYYLVPYLARP